MKSFPSLLGAWGLDVMHINMDKVCRIAGSHISLMYSDEI